MCNLKSNASKSIYKASRLTDIENKLTVSKGEGRGSDKLGVWD